MLPDEERGYPRILSFIFSAQVYTTRKGYIYELVLYLVPK